MPGPLNGIQVIELGGMAAAPFAGMILADYGASVTRIDRPGGAPESADSMILDRGRRSLSLDLKHPDAVGVVTALVHRADVFIDPFRPGVTERLGLGPAELLAINPRLIYGRLTGWGQSGPFAPMAGHDINYIALSGALEPIGRRGDPPLAPLNLLGDFGGGGMLLALGVCAALVSRSVSGQGQVLDAAMLDGAALLSTFVHQQRARGLWDDERGANSLSGASHYYDTYECADGLYLSIGPIEPRFYEQLLEWIGLDPALLPDQFDRTRWPELKERFAARIATRTRDEWCDAAIGRDICVAPVLTPAEAPEHPHNRAREVFVELGGVVQPAPAPRFDRTPASAAWPPPTPGQHSDEILREAGLDPASLRASGALG